MVGAASPVQWDLEICSVPYESEYGDMRIVGKVSACAILMASITTLLYLRYLEPGSSSPQKKPGVATVIGTRSSIIFDADGRVLNPILEKTPDAMATSERKTLMYAIKTIHDPSNNAQ